MGLDRHARCLSEDVDIRPPLVSADARTGAVSINSWSSCTTPKEGLAVLDTRHVSPVCYLQGRPHACMTREAKRILTAILRSFSLLYARYACMKREAKRIQLYSGRRISLLYARSVLLLSVVGGGSQPSPRGGTLGSQRRLFFRIAKRNLACS